MTKFNVGDKVLVTSREAKAVYNMVGKVLCVQEFTTNNFYTLAVVKNGKDMEFGLFENELTLLERKSNGTLNE